MTYEPREEKRAVPCGGENRKQTWWERGTKPYISSRIRSGIEATNLSTPSNKYRDSLLELQKASVNGIDGWRFN